MRATLSGLAALLVLVLSAPLSADLTSDIIQQATVAEYQSYLRVLTGVDPVPGNPPVYLTNRYSRGPDILIAGRWIKEQFESFGLTAIEHVFQSQYGPNIIAELPGTTRPQDIYIICGHYDTYNASNQYDAPGCDDDGSGTASAMIAARILAQYRFEGTIRFIAFSAEEQWMVGSLAYATLCRNRGDNILGVINLDMILHPKFDNYPTNPDYDIDIETDPNSEPLARYLEAKFQAYTPIDYQVHVDASNVSDHWAFWQRGYLAVGLSENTTQEIWGGSNNSYHTNRDNMNDPDYDWNFGIEVVRGALAGIVGWADVSLARPGDLNCDGLITFDDINPFVLALSDPAGYQAQFPNCSIMNGDLNGDGRVDFGDINPFVAVLTGP
ncbi:MAG: M28 family peptidase [Planctomycetota bacterium]